MAPREASFINSGTLRQIHLELNDFGPREILMVKLYSEGNAIFRFQIVRGLHSSSRVLAMLSYQGSAVPADDSM